MQRPHGSIVPTVGQQLGWLGFVQSALSVQISDPLHVVLQPIVMLPVSQHFMPPQSSTPSHVAEKPVHDAESATQVVPVTKSAQHFCVAPHVIVPHATPVDCDGASIMLLPLPGPPQMPETHCWPLGHACWLSHLKCVSP